MAGSAHGGVCMRISDGCKAADVFVFFDCLTTEQKKALFYALSASLTSAASGRENKKAFSDK